MLASDDWRTCANLFENVTGAVQTAASPILDAFTSPALLAFIVAALIITRGRGLLTQLLVEVALLLAIATFLFLQGLSPLPHFGVVEIRFADAWFRALAGIWWLIGARLVVNISVLVRGHNSKSNEARLFSDLAAAVIYITTILIILNSILDLNVGGLLVTSGVTAIILGLALQNTLADVFFGLAIGLEQPFHVGDRISIGDNVEGVLVQINWRSVRIHTDGDDLATIPNSIVAKGQIINRSVPTRRRAGMVEIATPSDVNSETVLELIWQAILLCPKLLPVPIPSIAIQRSGLHSCTYVARFFVTDSQILGSAKSALLCQIRRQFRHAGVGRPAPMMPVELLGSVALFKALLQPELEALLAELTVHSIDQGDTIFEEGAVATSIYVIESGVLEMSRQSPQSDGEVLGRIGAGEYIGELGLVTGSRRAFTVKSLTRGRILELPGDCVASLRKRNVTLNAELERSARKRTALLVQNDTARATHVTEHTTTVFARARALLGEVAVTYFNTSRRKPRA